MIKSFNFKTNSLIVATEKGFYEFSCTNKGLTKKYQNEKVGIKAIDK
jgi:hypothetical protein